MNAPIANLDAQRRLSEASCSETPKCALCGQTISYVTYGPYGPNPHTVWKHVGNRFQRTACKRPTPPPPCPICKQRGSFVRQRHLADGSTAVWTCNNKSCGNHMLYWYADKPSPNEKLSV
jgi:hypothetical protein